MTNFNRPTPEDEVFYDIARMMINTKQEIEKRQLKVKTEQQFYDELRNNVIEEVALHVEKLKGFGQDTISSLAIYIREMKK
jgi:hypothetical protein